MIKFMKNVFAYIQGNLRYQMYYSPIFSSMMRKHIKKQIDWRIEVMNNDCYNQGSCIECGCTTTALQMANKACDKPCYPPIMSRKKWKDFITTGEVKIGKDYWTYKVDRQRVQSTGFPKERNIVRHYIFKNSEIVHTKVNYI